MASGNGLVPNRCQLIIWTNDSLAYCPIYAFLGSMSYHSEQNGQRLLPTHDDVIKWKHFPRYWPFVRGIDRSPVNSPHKGQWRGTSMCSLICDWINDWANNRDAGDLIPYRTHYYVTVMVFRCFLWMKIYVLWLIALQFVPKGLVTIHQHW